MQVLNEELERSEIDATSFTRAVVKLKENNSTYRRMILCLM